MIVKGKMKRTAEKSAVRFILNLSRSFPVTNAPHKPCRRHRENEQEYACA